MFWRPSALRCGLPLLIAVACASAGCAGGARPPVVGPTHGVSASWILEGVGWVGVTVLPPGLAYDALGGDRVGGVSGLVEDPVSGLFVGIVDDRERPRLVSFSVTLRGTTPEVRPHSTLALDFAGQDDAPPMLDGEALVQLPDGDWLVASEGHAGASPRVPPASTASIGTAAFVRRWPCPSGSCRNRRARSAGACATMRPSRA